MHLSNKKLVAVSLLAKLLIFSALVPLGAELLQVGDAIAAGDDEKFENTEIRVIRPRFFNKRRRFELGVELSAIMNETFIYTFLGTGIASYHFTERWSIAASGSFGHSLDKQDKRLLFDEFDIKTKILRTLYTFEGQIMFTPMYGKWQLSSGKLVYFDTFLTGGFGMTGISYQYSDFCPVPTPEALASSSPPSAIPSDKIVPYPTLLIGIGQRYFVSKHLSYNVNINNHTVFAKKADGSCDLNHPDSGSLMNQSTLIQIGASKYF